MESFEHDELETSKYDQSNDTIEQEQFIQNENDLFDKNEPFNRLESIDIYSNLKGGHFARKGL